MLAAIALLNTSRTVDRELTARVIRVRAGRVKFKGNRLEVAMIISNPTSSDIVVNSVVGEVYLNGRKFGNVESFVKTIIKANNKTTLYLDVRIMLPQLMTELLDMANKKLSVQIDMTGSINVDNQVMPLSLAYKII